MGKCSRDMYVRENALTFREPRGRRVVGALLADCVLAVSSVGYLPLHRAMSIANRRERNCTHLATFARLLCQLITSTAPQRRET